MRRYATCFAGGTLASIFALSGCSSNGTLAMPRSLPQQSASLVHPDIRHRCPSKYSLGCITLTPTGESETITFSCDGYYDCPFPKWKMYNSFYTVKGKSARKDLAGKWDPNPYHSGPATYTINLIHERRGLKPSKKVEYYVDLVACSAHSSCQDLGTVGIIPEF